MIQVAFPRSLPRLFATLCAAGLLTVAPALASGGHSSDGGGMSAAPPIEQPKALPADPATAQDSPDDLTTCPRGKMWDHKRKHCIRMRSEALPDDAVADYAYALAKAGRYQEALVTLDLMKNGNTAEALNYRGYATRKLGRTDEGINYYLRSVALDPHYAKAREYLGEAYVIKGRLDLAKDQLTSIQTLCGPDCRPYRDLSDAIAKASTL